VEALIAAAGAGLVAAGALLALSFSLFLFAALSDAIAPTGITNTASTTAQIRVEMRIMIESLLPPTVVTNTCIFGPL
jgi:hypothetical protein